MELTKGNMSCASNNNAIGAKHGKQEGRGKAREAACVKKVTFGEGTKNRRNGKGKMVGNKSSTKKKIKCIETVDNKLPSSAHNDNTRIKRDSSTTKSQMESHYDPEYSSFTNQDLNIHKSITNLD